MPDALNTDVLIIGGGLSGVRAAQAAADAGAATLLVSKAPIGVGGASARASGGFATAFGPADSAEQHAHDTLTGGYGVNNTRQVEAVVQAAPEALGRLNAEVGGFAEENAPFCGQPAPLHTVARSVQYPHGMAHLMGRLRTGLKAADVELLENHRVVDLLFLADGTVVGAKVHSCATGELLKCRAKAVVLAAGGCGQLFPVTSNGLDATGDAYGLAMRAGCTLHDMEFIQYTPTAFAAPAPLRGQTIVGTLLTVAGVRLENRLGDRFMQRYAPGQMERAGRATLARAIFREVSKGRGTAAGGVYLDATVVSPDDFNRHRPGFYELCVAHGIDPHSSPLETAPSVHTCLGGIAVDEAFRAAPGLFVAGEALAGTHGANRLSSNSLTEANVTGWMAGVQAAAFALASVDAASAESEDTFLLPVRGPNDMAVFHERLKGVMGKAAGLERTADELQNGMAALAELRGEHAAATLDGVDDVGLWLDLRNMLLTAEAILGSALTREESRGAHFRSDFPERSNDNWHVNVAAMFQGDHLHFRRDPIV